MDVKRVKVRDIEVGGEKLTVAAGPCVLDTFDEALSIAREMKKYCAEFGFNYIFKASFDKANRTSIKSYRGPGLERGLEWLSEIGKEAGVPVVTDIHEPYQAEIAAKHVDLLQIPAFLCRQTDLWRPRAGPAGRLTSRRRSSWRRRTWPPSSESVAKAAAAT